MLAKLKKIKEDKLNNCLEDIILEKIADLLESDEFSNICICEHCLLDIASYTLNQIPAKYVTSDRGNVLARLADFEEQAQIDLDLVVIKSIKKVAKNPYHS
ncbi:competence protein ComFB [Orenia metallireducens]|uniref:Competence protein ComFB n=1 Tax=Orenia metallireducens TaxID=1413210 RepID=A0A285IDB5_9FIRM|nr:late competence development ComFB family protein [Orenia metallireducens]PRX19646.1 competence protein ComFB [Orenia metallireducens]SNY45978.1 competence protein ComFB [Orenia metallireducens]